MAHPGGHRSDWGTDAGHAWHNAVGINRIANLPGAPPGQHHDVVGPSQAAEVEMYLQYLRKRATEVVDRELMDDRMDIWDQEEEIENVPTWMTLTPAKNLYNWARIIQGDFGCDDRVCNDFVALLHTPNGFAEGSRILAYLLKDNDIDPARPPQSASAWLKSASKEAMDALSEPDFWNKGPQGPPHGKGERAHQKWHGPDYVRGASASSSSG